MKATRRWRVLAVLLSLTLAAAACGGDGDGGQVTGDTTAGNGEAPAGGGEIALDEEVEVAPGTVLPLPDCPTGWNPEEGLTADTIKIAISLPESGPVAALGQIDDGMRAYFDQMEPIDGRSIELVSRDDAYDPARTLTNTEDMLQTDKPFAFTYMIGTPNNLAIRDLLDEECVPQLFNSTGFPAWGDPATYPWTIGGLLSYKTEARMWCNYIADEIGKGTKVAGLFMDNDFGLSYRQEVEACAEEGLIQLVESVNHDPAAPDVTDEVTTLTAAGADVILLGTTGRACPQAMAALASTTDVTKILSYTCQGVATYFKPVDPAGEGVLVAVAGKDASMTDDPDVKKAIEILDAAGLNANEGSYFTGVIFAENLEGAFRQAAGMEGGLNRVNIMRAVWNAEWENPLALEGSTISTSGVDDAYLVEAAQFARYVPPAAGAELGTYEFIGDLIDVEGKTGSVGNE